MTHHNEALNLKGQPTAATTTCELSLLKIHCHYGVKRSNNNTVKANSDIIYMDIKINPSWKW